MAGRIAFTPRDIQEMQLSFSRGFSHGFLDGNNHKILVRGDYAKKRGIRLGVVESITPSGVRMNVDAPVKPGDGLVFDGDESTGRDEQGGRVYEVIPLARGTKDRAHVDGPTEFSGRVELRFGRATIDLRRLSVGQPVWKTDDPELTRRLRRSFEGPPNRKVNLDIEVVAVAGEPLRLTGRTANGHTRDGGIERAPGPGRDPSRRRNAVLGPARPARWNDLPAWPPRPDDRGTADGAR